MFPLLRPLDEDDDPNRRAKPFAEAEKRDDWDTFPWIARRSWLASDTADDIDAMLPRREPCP